MLYSLEFSYFRKTGRSVGKTRTMGANPCISQQLRHFFFNKAIDKTFNILEEFTKLTELDIDRVLTSGGAKTAADGKDIINEMVAMSHFSDADSEDSASTLEQLASFTATVNTANPIKSLIISHF